MATFLPIRGTQSEIDATAIVDGQLLFTTDTNNIYIDNGTTRTLYRSVSTVQLSSENTTTDAIAFGKDSSGNYGYYEAGSSELKSFKKGNATEAQVLSPYTFSNASASGLIGTMPNKGSLSFSPSTSTIQSLPAGYYSGGTLSTVNAYNAGYNAKTLHRVSVGSGGNGTSNTLTSHTFNVSAMLNNYKTLSVDDFEIVTTGISYTITQNNNPVTQQTLSKSYDADNGALTISNCLSNIYSNNYGGYVKTYIEYSIYAIF